MEVNTVTVRCANEECPNSWQEDAGMRRRRSAELAEMAWECGAVPQGEFRLSSGVMSDRYLDGITLALHGPAALSIGAALSREAREAGVDVIAGPALGAAPLVAAAVAHRAAEPGNRPLRGAIIREEWKNHGIGGMVAGKIRNRDKVMLVDDVITTGGSMSDSRQITLEQGGIILHQVVLLDRGQHQESGVISLIDPADLWGGQAAGTSVPWWGRRPCGQCITEEMICTSRPTIPEPREEMGSQDAGKEDAGEPGSGPARDTGIVAERQAGKSLRVLEAMFASMERNHSYEQFRSDMLEFEKKIEW